MPISNSKPDFYNTNAHSKSCENPLIFTRYCPDTKIRTDVRQTDDERTAGHMDDQRKTIKSRLYRVAGYTNGGISTKFILFLKGHILVALLDKQPGRNEVMNLSNVYLYKYAPSKV